jgi:PAS domain-containing protein
MDSLMWQYHPLMIPLGLSAIVCLTLTFIGGRHRAAPGSTAFTMLTLAMGAWIIGSLLELGAVGAAHKTLWALAQYLAIPYVPVAWFCFMLAYSGKGRLLTPLRLLLLNLLPLATSLMALTNPWHGWLLEQTWIETVRGTQILVRHFGPWFWLHTAYSYILLLLGCVLIIVAMARAPESYRGQRGALLLGCLLPWIGNIVYLFGAGLFDPRIDPTPFLFTLSSVMFAWAVFPGRLFTVVPVGHDAVIRNMPESVIILDGHDKVLDINPAARRLTASPDNRVLGCPVHEVFAAYSHLFTHGREAEETLNAVEVDIGTARSYFDLYAAPIRQGREIAARLYVLRNVTERQEAEAARLNSEKLKAALEMAGAVCHKLNQPIQGIIGYAELLMLRMDAEDELYRKVERIKAQAEKMGDITNKLMGITRYRTARYTLGETILDVERSSPPRQEINPPKSDAEA